MAIHFAEKYLDKLVESFKQGSETESLFSHDMDMQFTGVKTVHVKSLKTEPLENYNRAANITSASRYGTPVEMQDYEQTFTLTQDRSKPLTVDRGNEAENFNLKKAGKVMAAQMEEQIRPEIDTYRLAKWAKEAGIHKALTAAPTNATIVKQIIELHNDMIDAGVPESGVTLLIKRQYLPALKTSNEWLALDSLGGKSLPKGAIGELDGMPVKPMSSTRFPGNAAFMLLYKGSVISPVRFKDFRVHKDPPGLSGDLIEFRMMYDAFVLGHKANGVAVACLPDTVQAAPTISISSNAATITSGNATRILYTLDGSDPRYSVDAQVYPGSAVTVPAGATVKAYAERTGYWASAVSEKTNG